MIIQHNLASIGAFRQSKITTSRKARTAERLASGYRINRAADDAAGLKISQKMRVQIRGLAQANENIQDGINFVKVGESGMQEVHEILQRIRELSVQAANDTNTLGDRTAIQSEIDALSAEINSIAYSTSFNGHRMLCGETAGTIVGGGGSSGSVTDGGVSDALANRVTYGGSGNDHMNSAIRNPDGTVVFCGNTTSDDQDVISLCDQAISYVSAQRSRYGSYQNALEHLYAANAITEENVSASESLLADADLADEMVEFSRSKILEQANLSVMAQANMTNQSVLKLL